MRISDWSSDVCSSDLADARGLETGLRQVSRRAVTGRQERHFQRRDFVADALLHRLDAADRAENGVLRLVGLGVENDEPAITKQHGSIAAGKLDLAQTDQADALQDRKSTRLNSSH